MIYSSPGISGAYGPTAIPLDRAAQLSGGQPFADALAGASKQGGASSTDSGLDLIALNSKSGTPPPFAKSALILPTMNNVRILSSALKDELGSFFRENGISTHPPVELSVNSEGRIVVKGDRADAAQIEDLINSNGALSEDIRTLNAIAGLAHDLPRHLQFQAEYRASRNPEAVVAKYSDLFYPRPHTYSLRFGAEESDANLELLADGEAWSQTNVPTEAWAGQGIANMIEDAEDTMADTVAELGE